MKMKFISYLFAIVLLVATKGIANELPKQTTCPVMIGNPIDPSLYVDYNDQRIFLCCKSCVNMFQNSPETYLPNLPGHELIERAEHDHSTDHEAEPHASRLLSFMGKLHPIAVHIPIGLILAAALAEGLFLCFKKRIIFRSAARFNLYIALLGAVAAIPLGFAAASGTAYPADYNQVLLLHRALGITTLALCLLTVITLEIGSRKHDQKLIWIFRVLLLLSVGSVAVAGHLGGLLVYGLENFTW